MGIGMSDQSQYHINTDVRFGPLEFIDIPELVEENDEEWSNQTLCRVNDCVVRLGIIRGEFHWHKHDQEDEFFLVLDGRLILDIQDKGVVVLERHQAYTVPKGVVHRSRAPQRTVILMIEPTGVVPTGD